MPIPAHDLIREFGAAALAGRGSVFVGAGLSKSAGYPDWEEILAAPRAERAIPETVTDLPLVAEYYVQEAPGGRPALESHILKELAAATVTAPQGHKSLLRLPVDDNWTTNYDALIEDADPRLAVIALEEDFKAPATGRRRLIKMHGSVTDMTSTAWLAHPVITRTDYETYEQRYPRTSAALRASYLTRAFLFLGFSFADPNVEVLLRLSRTMGAGTREHFTVMRRPTDPDDARLHDLRVKDLEASGVGVCEIDDYDELTPLLGRLVRRTREARVFLGGSDSGSSNISASWPLGHRLAAIPELSVGSLAGPAALSSSFAFGNARQAVAQYDPDDIKFFFRTRLLEAAPPLEQRTGTAIYSGLEKEALRTHVLDESRVAVFVGGGDNTADEIDQAVALGVPVIPLPRSGGAAEARWNGLDLESALQGDTSTENERDWKLLAEEDPGIHVEAAARLVERLAYLST